MVEGTAQTQSQMNGTRYDSYLISFTECSGGILKRETRNMCTLLCFIIFSSLVLVTFMYLLIQRSIYFSCISSFMARDSCKNGCMISLQDIIP